MEIISGKDARARGLKRYFTGKPCKYGHLAQRSARTNNCCECSDLRLKVYYQTNREHVRETQRRSLKKALERDSKVLSKRAASYRARNYEKYRETANRLERERRSRLKTEDPEGYRELKRVYHQRYKAKHGERIRERGRLTMRRLIAKQKAEDPAGYKAAKKARKALRRARILGNGGTHTADDIQTLLKTQRSRCAGCRVKVGKIYHVDHIQPLVRKGRNDRKNLQILCALCNQRKQARDPMDFMREEFGLLL